MSPLLRKEVRLVWPSFLTAVLLAMVPPFLLPAGTNLGAVTIGPFTFGVMLLALAPFGREFGLNTFALALSQPVERRQCWWSKVGLLAAAIATVFGLWCNVCWWKSPRAHEDSMFLVAGAVTSFTCFAGGLWTTLLVRQVMAAFWLALLVPGGLALSLDAAGASNNQIAGAEVIYSALGVFIAWKHFRTIQETGWTGGEVTFGNRAASRHGQLRCFRPFAALLGKELRLHQFGLLGIGGLFVFHLGAVAVLAKAGNSLSTNVRDVLASVGGTWFLAALFVTAPVIAEERKLGTEDALFCLPVSRRRQFWLKLLSALLIAGVLTAILACLAEWFGWALGAQEQITFLGRTYSESLLRAFLVMPALALAGFYGSTFGRNLVQGLAGAVGATIVLWLLAFSLTEPQGIFWWIRFHLWRGPLVLLFEVPTFLAVVVWLTWRNFQNGPGTPRFWRRNIAGLVGATVFVALATMTIANRAWEFLEPLEPSHGAAQLGSASARTLGASGSTLVAQLPGGRIWMQPFGYEEAKRPSLLVKLLGARPPGHLVTVGTSRELPGTNWISVASLPGWGVGLKSDGTLWSFTVTNTHRRSGEFALSPPQQVGSGHDWIALVRNTIGERIGALLLRSDGTLWSLDVPASPPDKKYVLTLPTLPTQLGADTDWAKAMTTGEAVYLWKTNGQAWVMHSGPVVDHRPGLSLDNFGAGRAVQRERYFDGARWKSLTSCWPAHAAVGEDGSLYVWIPDYIGWHRLIAQLGETPHRLGHDGDWVSVGGAFQRLFALRADGTLWHWDMDVENGEQPQVSLEATTRVGSHRDWVALGSALGGGISLAADGSIWFWRGAWGPDETGMMPSRKPVRLANVFTSESNR